MRCKNCAITLKEGDNFCSNCGGKVIRKRLTLKNLFAYFSETFLNYDNKLLQTYITLFRRPEEVIGSYINGTRKKYVDAVSIFAIAVTVSGLFFFVFLKFFPDILNFTSSIYDFNEEQAKISTEFNRKIFESQSLLFFVSIPVFAFISRLVFLKNKKYNFSEHLVINLYTYSQISLTVNILYFLTIWYQPLFLSIAALSSLFQIVFFAYVLKRMYALNLRQILLKTLLFFLFLVPLLIVVSMIASILMYFLGYYDEIIELEKAKKGTSYIVSSAINWTSYRFL